MTIALIDANAFYCSAQTLFEPWLRDHPVVVASNNDGCVVSRNDAAKALGIKMGQPVFELREMASEGRVKIFSSNYQLYQSLSNRMMAILEEISPRIFIYSIDECFAWLAGVPDPEAWGRNAQAEVMRRIGLPVGVGIAQTKTLAKLANWAAKKWKAQTGCVVSILDTERRDKLLRYAPVGEVWGIGSRLSARLDAELGIKTAWQLATADPKLLRRYFNVNVERTARELTGVQCFPFVDGGPERKQQIICSRSFGKKISSLDCLRGAVTTFALELNDHQSWKPCASCLCYFRPFDPVMAIAQYQARLAINVAQLGNNGRDVRAPLIGPGKLLSMIQIYSAQVVTRLDVEPAQGCDVNVVAHHLLIARITFFLQEFIELAEGSNGFGHDVSP
ncbi:Y-family DNA polymerase [Pseudomonas wenzhouensis]|nr:Y-family DNA polymerase [Pseudomonas wenzhouensis]MDM9653223.1 Y-family DNA polymerase [Pseudomonas wenzhouensis]